MRAFTYFGSEIWTSLDHPSSEHFQLRSAFCFLHETAKPVLRSMRLAPGSDVKARKPCASLHIQSPPLHASIIRS
jgi:hypothetical protein